MQKDVLNLIQKVVVVGFLAILSSKGHLAVMVVMFNTLTPRFPSAFKPHHCSTPIIYNYDAHSI